MNSINASGKVLPKMSWINALLISKTEKMTSVSKEEKKIDKKKKKIKKSKKHKMRFKLP